MLLLVAIMYYEGNFNFTNFASKVDYRDRFLLNANAYSYFSFFANFSLLYLYQKYKSKFWLLLLIILPILFIIISFATQSRSGIFIIILINTCYWIFINKTNHSNQLKKIVKGIFVFSAFIIICLQFIKIYENSRIKSRIEVTGTKVDSREVLVYESMRVFGNSPYLGVGLGQLIYHNGIGQFSHNSYVEILAEQGIIGGILLIFLFGIPLRKCWHLLKINPNEEILKINLLFFVSFYLFNNIYPFYKFTFSMMYFFIIISMQNKIDITKK
jgi:O-antigen ligase